MHNPKEVHMEAMDQILRQLELTLGSVTFCFKKLEIWHLSLYRGYLGRINH